MELPNPWLQGQPTRVERGWKLTPRYEAALYEAITFDSEELPLFLTDPAFISTAEGMKNVDREDHRWHAVDHIRGWLRLLDQDVAQTRS